MIIIGVGQMIAGILLIISGITLADQSVLFATIDIAFGLFILWHSVSKIDPPSKPLKV